VLKFALARLNSFFASLRPNAAAVSGSPFLPQPPPSSSSGRGFSSCFRIRVISFTYRRLFLARPSGAANISFTAHAQTKRADSNGIASSTVAFNSQASVNSQAIPSPRAVLNFTPGDDRTIAD
jgi:hypothetical protein